MKTNLWKWDDTILKASIQLNKRESLVGEKKKSRAKRKEKNYSIEDDPREQLRFEAYAQEELIDRRRMIDHEIMSFCKLEGQLIWGDTLSVLMLTASKSFGSHPSFLRARPSSNESMESISGHWAGVKDG
jgi:hypothetical protein